MTNYANKSFVAKNHYITHGKPIPFEIGDEGLKGGFYYVSTYEYKGKKKYPIKTEYTQEALDFLVNQGIIKEVSK